MSLFNRSQLKQEFKTGTLSTEQKFSILIDSTYNRIEDSILMGPLGYVGTSGLIGPPGGTHVGLFVGSGPQGAVGKVIILDEGIQVYNTDLQTWIILGSTSTLASNTIFSSSDIFTLRYGKEQGLLTGELSGIKIANYNGIGDAGLYINNLGDFLIENEWGQNIISYREETPLDKSFSYWSEFDRKYLSGNIYSGPSGNIGIGNTEPLYTLDIEGDINFNGDLYQNGEKFVSSEWTKNLDGSIYYLGNVGIGISDPINKLEVGGDIKTTGSIYIKGSFFASSNAAKSFFIDRYSTNPFSDEFAFRKGRGTELSKLKVELGDELGGVEFHGWNGNGFTTASMIRGYVDGITETGKVPGRLSFFVNGGTESGYGSEAMTIKNNTYIGIGTQTPDQKLTVQGNLKVTGSIYDSKNSPGTNGEVLVSTETGTDWKALPEIYGVTGTGAPNHIVKWTDSDSIEASSIVESGSTVLIGPTNSTDLVVSGKIQSGGTIPTTGNEIDQIMTFTKFLRLTGDWQDIGINAGDLQTGTYIIQLYANDSWQGGSNNNEYYSDCFGG